MKLNDVKARAKKAGVDAGKMKKEDLIRAIQKAEGNSPCFESGISTCGQRDCCWFKDCQND